MPTSIQQTNWTAPWTSGTINENGFAFGTGITDFNAVGPWSVGARPASVTINVSATVGRQVTVTTFDAVAVSLGTVTVTYPVGNSTIVVPLTFATHDIVRLRITQTTANNAGDMLVNSIDVAGITTVGFCFWSAPSGEVENC